MNCLIDTCALLWLVNGDAQLTKRARQAIAAQEANIFLSAVVAAELSIKVGKGKIELPQAVQPWIEHAVRLHHLTLLPLELGPAATAGLLPWIHSDPFDRLLVATAQHHSLAIITSDEQIPKYPDVKIIW